VRFPIACPSASSALAGEGGRVITCGRLHDSRWPAGYRHNPNSVRRSTRFITRTCQWCSQSSRQPFHLIGRRTCKPHFVVPLGRCLQASFVAISCRPPPIRHVGVSKRCGWAGTPRRDAPGRNTGWCAHVPGCRRGTLTEHLRRGSYDRSAARLTVVGAGDRFAEACFARLDLTRSQRKFWR